MQIYFSLIISAVILRMPIVLFFFFFSSQEDYSIGLTVIALKASMIHVWQITLFLPWITITNDLIQLFVFEVLGNVGRTFHQKNEIKHFQVFHSSERNYFMVEWRLLLFFFLSFCNLQRDFIEIINCVILFS